MQPPPSDPGTAADEDTTDHPTEPGFDAVVQARVDAFTAPRLARGGLVSNALRWICIVLAAVPWVAWAWGAVAAVPPWPVVLVLTLLPYGVVSVLTLLFVVWTIWPDRLTPPVLLLLTLAFALGRWGPGWSSSPEAGASDAREMTVMSWNVRRLWGAPGDGGDTPACVAQAVDEADPDVLVFLEVTADDTSGLANDLQLSCRHSRYRTSDATGAAGMAVCSRGLAWPLHTAAIVPYDLPPTLGDTHDVHDEAWQFIEARVGPVGDRWTIQGVHLAPHRLLDDPVGRWQKTLDRAPHTVAVQHGQAEVLLRRARATEGPLVLAGDFNAARDVPLHDRLRAELTDAWERGGTGLASTVTVLDLLPLRIDYVYAGPDLAVLSATIPDVGCSDHRPVVSTFARR